MFLLLFAGFLRFNELSNLRCNDIEIFESHMDILIRKSKTDQLRLGNHTVIARTGLVSCPVQAMERYLIAAGLKSAPGEQGICLSLGLDLALEVGSSV